MPRSSGIFTLVPSYLAVSGQTVEVENHNPPLEDIAQALTDSLPRDGSAPMTGNLPMGGSKITGLAAGTAPGDAVRFEQLPSSAAVTALNALTPAADRVPYFTGPTTAALATLTAAGRAILDDADAAAQRTTLGATVTGSSLFTAADAAAARTAIGATATGSSLITAADAAAARAVIGAGITLGTAQTPTSGTVVNFTGIPSTARRVKVSFAGISTNGSSPIEVRLGTSGGVVNTGYTAGASYQTAAGAIISSTTGFPINPTGAMNSAQTQHGAVVFENISGNLWVGSGTMYAAGNITVAAIGGSITLGAVLDRIQITTQNGTDAFDAGTVNISWE